MKPYFLTILVVGLVAQGIGRGQSPVDSKEQKQALQMQEAILRKQDVGEVRRILKAGFDVNAPIGCGTYSAVDGAVQVESMGILTLLLEAGAKPKGTALLSAARCRDLDQSSKMVEALLKRGADPNYKDYYMGDQKRFSTPLHAACFQGNYLVVQLLVRHSGIELDSINIDDRTPLMWAVERGYESIIGLLLEKGADPKIRNAAGKTAAEIAREQIQKREKILGMISSTETHTEPGRYTDGRATAVDNLDATGRPRR
ncbi:MAG: ankyrin repeat domain-containing protein [Verrucomicrobiota bacterium]